MRSMARRQAGEHGGPRRPWGWATMVQICRLIIVGLLASVVSLASVGGLLSKVCLILNSLISVIVCMWVEIHSHRLPCRLCFVDCASPPPVHLRLTDRGALDSIIFSLSNESTYQHL
mgnify:CR=1 FL=1